MKAFGIEVRKVGNITALYSDVDLVLRKANITPSGVSSDLQAQTVAHALQKMLRNDSFFSICTIENCAKVCGVIIPIERMRIYHAIHCVDWNQMLPDYRQTIIAMVLDDFRGILNPDPSPENPEKCP